MSRNALYPYSYQYFFTLKCVETAHMDASGQHGQLYNARVGSCLGPCRVSRCFRLFASFFGGG